MQSFHSDFAFIKLGTQLECLGSNASRIRPLCVLLVAKHPPCPCTSGDCCSSLEPAKVTTPSSNPARLAGKNSPNSQQVLQVEYAPEEYVPGIAKAGCVSSDGGSGQVQSRDVNIIHLQPCPDQSQGIGSKLSN